MMRVNVFVEGQTEETFVRDVLGPYFANQAIYLTPILAMTSPGHKGGIVSYGKVKHQVTRLCKQDSSAYVTTLIDYYGLPKDFPALDDVDVSASLTNIHLLEKAFAEDINQPNFIPNFMLHEFESLLFCEPKKFAEWLDDDAPIQALLSIKGDFETPEHINNNPLTAPSKRIIAAIPYYKKTLHGPLIAEDIGIDQMRAQCIHFNEWVERIVSLNNQAVS